MPNSSNRPSHPPTPPRHLAPLLLGSHSQTTEDALLEMERLRREFMEKHPGTCERVKLATADGLAVVDGMKVFHANQSSEPSQQKWIVWFNGTCVFQSPPFSLSPFLNQ